MGEFQSRDIVDCSGAASTGGTVEAWRREVRRAALEEDEEVNVEGRCRRDVRRVERANRRAKEEGGRGGMMTFAGRDRFW